MQTTKLTSTQINSLNFKEISRNENSNHNAVLYSNEYFNPDFSSEFGGIRINANIWNTFDSNGEERWSLKIPGAFSNPSLTGFNSHIELSSLEELEIQINKIKEALGLN
ncbi:hypothetical protein LBMAG27_16060 [Bacteroidota bacterium]|nr:hypothetical protein LBMAG27_16060 [Bacteroidota bacterium]